MAPAVMGNAPQLAALPAVMGNAPQLALRKITVTKSAGVQELLVCHKCALGEEIKKNVQCARCGVKANTLLMVASPELWPDTRAGSFCARCKHHFAEGVSGVYTLARSAETWGNVPICCSCYGIESPIRHLRPVPP